jgi:hypothetical protein
VEGLLWLRKAHGLFQGLGQVRHLNRAKCRQGKEECSSTFALLAFKKLGRFTIFQGVVVVDDCLDF